MNVSTGRHRSMDRCQQAGDPRPTPVASSDRLIPTQTCPSGFSEAARRPDRPLSGSVSAKQPLVTTRPRPAVTHERPFGAVVLGFGGDIPDSWSAADVSTRQPVHPSDGRNPLDTYAQPRRQGLRTRRGSP
jgi:hypothetical protein